MNVVDSVILGNISGSDGAIYLNGGTLSTKSIVKGEGAGKVEFYGGTLKATAAGTLIGSGLTVNVPSGYTGTIDTSGFDVTVESAVGGSGTLNIVGSGKVTFATMPGCRVLSADDTPYVFPVPTFTGSAAVPVTGTTVQTGRSRRAVPRRTSILMREMPWLR